MNHPNSSFWVDFVFWVGSDLQIGMNKEKLLSADADIKV